MAGRKKVERKFLEKVNSVLPADRGGVPFKAYMGKSNVFTKLCQRKEKK